MKSPLIMALMLSFLQDVPEFTGRFTARELMIKYYIGLHIVCAYLITKSDVTVTSTRL